MAKDFKDHGSIVGGRVYGNRFVPRLVFAILLVTIGILGYSYWALLSSHRDTTIKMTLLKADFDSTQATKAELTKMMESCKDELKSSREEYRRLKDAQANLEQQVKLVEETRTKLANEKNMIEENSRKEISDCQQSAKNEVSKCNASCDKKINDVKRAADEQCQQLQPKAFSTGQSVVQADVQQVNQEDDGNKDVVSLASS